MTLKPQYVGQLGLDGKTAREYAQSITSFDLVVRRSDQSINIGSIVLAVVGLLVIPYWYLHAVVARIDRGQQKKIARATELYELLHGTGTPQPASINLDYQFNIYQLTPTPTATVAATQLAQLAPIVAQGEPTSTVRYDVADVQWVFSYYYPDLVGVDPVKYAANCAADNVEVNPYGKVTGCKDTTASGQSWKSHIMYHDLTSFYNGGVAVPFVPDTLTPIFPFGTVLRVDAPSSIAGRYLVIDLCGACDDYYQSNGVLFLDFVAKGMPVGLNWWVPVVVGDIVYPDK